MQLNGDEIARGHGRLGARFAPRQRPSGIVLAPLGLPNARSRLMPPPTPAVERNALQGGAVVAHETIDGTYRQTNLRNESPEYLRKREELRLAEIELLNQRERVAALRRQLPTGATLQDYDLLEEPASLDADRKSTRLNSSHVRISYAVFCLKKKTHLWSIS